MATDSFTIKLMRDSSVFADYETQSTSVGQLRSELSLGANATVNVNTVVSNDNTTLSSDDYVAVVSSNKTGGKKKKQ